MPVSSPNLPYHEEILLELLLAGPNGRLAAVGGQACLVERHFRIQLVSTANMMCSPPTARRIFMDFHATLGLACHTPERLLQPGETYQALLGTFGRGALLLRGAQD